MPLRLTQNFRSSSSCLTFPVLGFWYAPSPLVYFSLLVFVCQNSTPSIISLESPTLVFWESGTWDSSTRLDWLAASSWICMSLFPECRDNNRFTTTPNFLCGFWELNLGPLHDKHFTDLFIYAASLCFPLFPPPPFSNYLFPSPPPSVFTFVFVYLPKCGTGGLTLSSSTLFCVSGVCWVCMIVYVGQRSILGVFFYCSPPSFLR